MYPYRGDPRGQYQGRYDQPSQQRQNVYGFGQGRPPSAAVYYPAQSGYEAPAQEQKWTDQDYVRFNLYDFKGRLDQHVVLAAGRRAVVRLFTGRQSEHWVIQELIESMGVLVQYQAGITFIGNINDKMMYRSQAWTDAIFRHFEQILTCQAGYRLFSMKMGEAPDNYITPFVRFCFGKFDVELEDDEEFIHLICVIIQAISDTPTEYQRFLGIGIYLMRPRAAGIATTLLEYGDGRAIANFEEEIVKNVMNLIASDRLTEIVSACLIRGPRVYRNAIIQQLVPIYQELIASTWTWQLVMHVLSVGTMPQKVHCAEVVLRFVQSSTIPAYMDQLLVHALNSVDARSRIKMVKDIVFLVNHRSFPLLTDYLLNLERVLSAQEN